MAAARSTTSWRGEQAYGKGLFLIRPDGHIAVAADIWTGTDLTGLLDRLGLR